MVTFARYLLFQLPGWLLAAVVLCGLWEWAGLSGRLAVALWALYVLKDLAFFPLVRRAYEPDGRTGGERLIGKTGIARQALAPRGYVLVGAELWNATVEPGQPPIAAGAPVRVVGAHRLMLVVVPA